MKKLFNYFKSLTLPTLLACLFVEIPLIVAAIFSLAAGFKTESLIFLIVSVFFFFPTIKGIIFKPRVAWKPENFFGVDPDKEFKD